MRALAMDPLEQLFRTEHDRLWKSLLAFSGDAEIASEAEAETYTQAVARGDDLVDPRAWIWRSAFKIAGGLLAKRSRSPDRALPAEADLPTTGDLQVDSSLAEFVDQLGGLSEQQRLVVVLRYAAGILPTEIAEQLGTTAGTVRVQLHRAHAQLREQMGNR